MANRSDNFNRADSSSGLGSPSDGGASWIARDGTFGISNNQAYKVTAANAGNFATLDASSADVEVSATMAVINSLSAPGLVVRCSDASNYFSVQCRGTGYGNRIELYRVQSGSPTSLGTYTGTVSAGDVIMASCDGDTINIYQNGTLRIGPITSSFNNTATEHGITAYYSQSGGDVGSNTYACRHDDFTITDLNGGGSGRRRRRALTGVGR